MICPPSPSWVCSPRAVHSHLRRAGLLKCQSIPLITGYFAINTLFSCGCFRTKGNSKCALLKINGETTKWRQSLHLLHKKELIHFELFCEIEKNSFTIKTIDGTTDTQITTAHACWNTCSFETIKQQQHVMDLNHDWQRPFVRLKYFSCYTNSVI